MEKEYEKERVKEIEQEKELQIGEREIFSFHAGTFEVKYSPLSFGAYWDLPKKGKMCT